MMRRKSWTVPQKKRELKRPVAASRPENLSLLLKHAREVLPPELSTQVWGAASWKVSTGRLTELSGRRPGPVILNFSSSLRPELQLPQNWIILVQALMVVRFSNYHQSVSNQRQFISSAALVAAKVTEAGRTLHQLNRGDLDGACEEIGSKYSASAAYTRHNSVEEFVRLGVEYGVFGDSLNGYVYSKRKRSDAQSGIGYSRLDSPTVDYDRPEKMVKPIVVSAIGDLFRKVPRGHKYRLYILILSFAALLGRRFSEIASLPFQKVHQRESGRCSIYYFPGKQVKGRAAFQRRKIWIPTHLVKTIKEIIDEIHIETEEHRERAIFIVKNNRADTRFLEKLPPDMKIYAPDLLNLGLPKVWLDNNKWLAKNGFVFSDTVRNYGGPARNYTFPEHLIARCASDYEDSHSAVKITDQHGITYHTSDLMFIRSLGSSSGAYSPWITTECTHSMFTTFLRYLPDLCYEYTDAPIKADFTIHHFRHTVSTLLEDGGLSELLQADFLGRGHVSENPTYQHRSPEQRSLELMADLLSGRAKGHIADLILNEPLDKKAAIILAKTNGMHDVGTGCCTHALVKEPCPHATNCDGGCDHLVYLPDDESQNEELVRRLKIAWINLRAVSNVLNSGRPRSSGAWVEAHEKSINYLTKRLRESGMSEEELNQIKESALNEI